MTGVDWLQPGLTALPHPVIDYLCICCPLNWLKLPDIVIKRCGLLQDGENERKQFSNLGEIGPEASVHLLHLDVHCTDYL
jgi:hypothetical protein